MEVLRQRPHRLIWKEHLLILVHCSQPTAHTHTHSHWFHWIAMALTCLPTWTQSTCPSSCCRGYVASSLPGYHVHLCYHGDPEPGGPATHDMHFQRRHCSMQGAVFCRRHTAAYCSWCSTIHSSYLPLTAWSTVGSRAVSWCFCAGDRPSNALIPNRTCNSGGDREREDPVHKSGLY